MADDVIRLDLELDSSQAQKQAQKFISDLEKRFQQLKAQLSKALEDGIVDASDSRDVQRLTKEIDRLEKELNQLKKSGDTSGKSISKLGIAFSALGGVVAALGLAKIAQGFVNLAKDAFQATSALEQTTNALESLVARELVQTGQFDNLQDALSASSERAAELLDFIRELARQSPFSREQIQAAFQTALAYGFTIEEAQRLTAATVDLAAATGAGAEATGRIALALGQIQAKGKVSAEELNQLRESGLNVNPILEDLGFTLDDVSRGLVDADVFIQAVIDSLERDFGGAAARATNSLAGLVSTLGDLKTDALIAFFEPAIRILQPQLADLTTGFSDLIPLIEEVGANFGEFVSNIIQRLPDANELLSEFNNLLSGANQITTQTEDVELAGTLEEQIGLLQKASKDLEELPITERIAASFSGADSEIQSQLERIVKSIVAGSKDIEEAQNRLRFFFGEDAVGELKGFEGGRILISLTGDINESFKELEFGYGELIERSNDFVEATEATAQAEREAAEATETRERVTGALQDRIAQKNIVEQRSAQIKKEEAEATKLQAIAERELVIELVKSQKEADKNAVAIFEQAEAAGASSEQLRGLAIELGLLTDEQIVAQESLNQLVIAFVNGEISAEQFKIQAADLNNIIAGTSLATAQAAVSINALNDAFNRAISPQKRRSGGRADTTQRDTLLQEAKDIEAQADAIESAVSRFGEIARLDADALQELIDNSRDFGDELFDLTQQAGASIDTLIELGVATGEFTEEQAQAALEVIQREKGIRAIAEALATQSITTEEATAAAAELNRQIAEGEQVDLSAFGVDVEALETDQVPALLRETAQATREAAEALTQIAGALGGVAAGSETLSQAIKRETAQKKLNSAETLNQRLEAIALANAFGLLTDAEVEQTVQLALLDELASRNVLSNEQLSQVLTLVADEGFTVAEALAEIGISAEEIPDDIEVLIETNSEEILEQVSAVNDALNELDGKQVEASINLVETREQVTVETGGTGAGSIPIAEDGEGGSGFARGGFTGQGNPNDIAGVVHREELVVPPNVLKGGIPAIASFAANNVPDLRNSVALASPNPIQNAVVPNTTFINNTTGDTITNSRSNDSVYTTNNYYGVSGKQIARSVQNTQFRQRQNNAMKRNIITTALT